MALIGQDMVRRGILRERDVPGGVNIAIIDSMVRFTLDHGHHTGPSYWYYLDVSA